MRVCVCVCVCVVLWGGEEEEEGNAWVEAGGTRGQLGQYACFRVFKETAPASGLFGEDGVRRSSEGKRRRCTGAGGRGKEDLGMGEKEEVVVVVGRWRKGAEIGGARVGGRG